MQTIYGPIFKMALPGWLAIWPVSSHMAKITHTFKMLIDGYKLLSVFYLRVG